MKIRNEWLFPGNSFKFYLGKNLANLHLENSSDKCIMKEKISSIARVLSNQLNDSFFSSISEFVSFISSHDSGTQDKQYWDKPLSSLLMATWQPLRIFKMNAIHSFSEKLILKNEDALLYALI